MHISLNPYCTDLCSWHASFSVLISTSHQCSAYCRSSKFEVSVLFNSHPPTIDAEFSYVLEYIQCWDWDYFEECLSVTTMSEAVEQNAQTNM